MNFFQTDRMKPNFCSHDALLKMQSFMNTEDLLSLTQVNKNIGKDKIIANQYLKIFGKINKEFYEKSNLKCIGQLISCAEKQPDPKVNHNIYKIPNTRLERWKWIVGVENSLDEEVRKNYNNAITFLENTQATSIIQLKNQMQAFWHLDRQIKDYQKFKSEERARATRTLMSSCFFDCLEFFFKLYYNPSVLRTGKNLEQRSRETFAQIGTFSIEEKDYDVVAFHILTDKKSVDDSELSQTEFYSVTWGRTYVGICEKNKPHLFTLFGNYGPNPNFSVLIGREIPQDTKSKRVKISTEESTKHGQEAVLNSRRHLVVGKGLTLPGGTANSRGTDRLLDLKLIQIMVEMTRQNKDIISLRVDSVYDYLPVLTAAGFNSVLRKAILEIVKTFRSDPKNKLFPPYQDYGCISTVFNTKDLEKRSVILYSRETTESWADIIKREPILKPQAAILPEYWENKPNIIAE